MKTVQRILSLKALNSLIILIILTTGGNLNAQVTVGSEDAPQPFSLLEITTANRDGGLRMPQLTTAERDALDLSANPGEAKGLVIYNTDNNCIEYWNLTEWVSLCFGKAVATIDPTTFPPGTGTVAGRTCFDIAETNDNINDCGALNGRIQFRANFNSAATNTQVYTFTPIGAVSKVRFVYVESQSGVIVDSFTPSDSYENMTDISGDCTATLIYKSSLSSPNPDAPSTGTAVGLTTAQALTVDIYAIYNDNADGTGTDHAVKLTASIKDCSCCGAETVSGGWLTFMCHNLGVDESLDPFTHNTGLYGDLYQWGRPADGHEKRTSGTTTTLADSNTPNHANFISSSASPNDWRSGGGNTSRWGNGTQNEDIPKAANDPCPAGWKVPSQKQWASIYTDMLTPNTWKWMGNGYKVGDALYLPAAGNRSYTDILGNTGSNGYYWSSTVTGTTSYNLHFNGSSVNPANTNRRGNGFSVRCVQDENAGNPVIDPTPFPAGTGTVAGRTCFDIAETNDNINDCGALTGRIQARTNFNEVATNTQVYTFTPSKTVSKVRFVYVESQSGMIVDSFTPGDSYENMTDISGSCTVTLIYKTNLSSPNPDAPSTGTAVGLTTAQALTVDIYAIYNDNADGTGTDRAVKLTASIKDCACCGAMTTNGTWLNFMCHNLGADESLDPFVWSSIADNRGDDIKGDLYQWGRLADGHEKRNSSTTSTSATNNAATAPVAVVGKFIVSSLSAFPNDWRSGGGNDDRWGDGTQNGNMAKAANDPCPSGWKVPSIKQWQSIFSGNEAILQSPNSATANTWSWTGKGFKIGQSLFLPAAGYRNFSNAFPDEVGSYGYYWSSTVTYVSSYFLSFSGSSSVSPADSGYRGNGISVRCVQDENTEIRLYNVSIPSAQMENNIKY